MAGAHTGIATSSRDIILLLHRALGKVKTGMCNSSIFLKDDELTWVQTFGENALQWETIQFVEHLCRLGSKLITIHANPLERKHVGIKDILTR